MQNVPSSSFFPAVQRTAPLFLRFHSSDVLRRVTSLFSGIASDLLFSSEFVTFSTFFFLEVILPQPDLGFACRPRFSFLVKKCSLKPFFFPFLRFSLIHCALPHPVINSLQGSLEDVSCEIRTVVFYGYFRSLYTFPLWNDCRRLEEFFAATHVSP